ncbi:MAG: histidine kinase, partial [Xanthomonadales bacterium]|nr:histidine kinase [Xanthomonadales bacterium]
MPDSEARKAARLKWMLFALAGWTVLAAIPTSSAYIAEGSLGVRRWLFIFGNIAPYYYLWALFTPAIYRLSTTVLNPARGILPAVLGHTAIAVSLSLVFGFVLHYENWHAWLMGAHAPGYYTMSAFSYIFILLGIYLYALQDRVRRQDALIARQQRHELALESSLARSQIEALRGQMNPHFLFNALNCIGALIETGQNDRAYEALEDLGALLRTSLEHRNHELVPLREELAFARRYIAMEQVRFGARLEMDISVDSAADQWMVPPFVLQPLIENT